MLDSQQPFEEAKAQEIVSRTRFVSECSCIWQIKVKSSTHVVTRVTELFVAENYAKTTRSCGHGILLSHEWKERQMPHKPWCCF
jgi:hypothetical protein